MEKNRHAKRHQHWIMKTVSATATSTAIVARRLHSLSLNIYFILIQRVFIPMYEVPNGVSHEALQEEYDVMAPISEAEFQYGDVTLQTAPRTYAKHIYVRKSGEDWRVVFRRLSKENLDTVFLVNLKRIILVSFHTFTTPVDNGGACSSFDLPNMLKTTIVFHDMSLKTLPSFPIAVKSWNMKLFQPKMFSPAYCLCVIREECHCRISLDSILEVCSEHIVFAHLRKRCLRPRATSGVSAVCLCSLERLLAIQLIQGREGSQLTHDKTDHQKGAMSSTDSEPDTVQSEV